jgi:acetyl-CoA acetyltransferase
MAAKHSNAAIVGIGQTEFSKESGRSELQLACEAIKSALDDCGLKPADVDGLVTFTLDTSEDLDVIRSTGMKEVHWSVRTPHGGGGACATIYQAMLAIEAGAADVVVAYRAFNERSGRRFGQPTVVTTHTAGGGTSFAQWCMPYGALTPGSWAALMAQRYMETHGVTSEDLGRIAVLQRKHAATNPAAWFYGKPITLADHQASRWIAEPVLRLLDCCQESDGGVAIVITSRERARDLKQKPVRILGAAQGIPYGVEIVTGFYELDLTHAAHPEMFATARRLYERTGLRPADFQLAMLYDAFTPQVLTQLEAYQFCGIGEAKDFIKDGHVEIGGTIPINTNGGLIGEAYIHGMNNITEAVRQLRGTAANPVSSVERVLVSSGICANALGLD